MKHNKKRNTAFVYEILAREFTKAVIDKDSDRKTKLVSIMKEHFNSQTILAEELSLYAVLLETRSVSEPIAERLLSETKKAYERLDEKTIFEAQSKLISVLNKEVGQEVWKNFVPNFKSLASVNAIFNTNTGVKKRVLFEQDIVHQMSSATALVESKQLKPLDNLTYTSFINKFNEKYDTLLAEQKELLNHYIASFADGGLGMNVYLNAELGRLKTVMSETVDAQSETLIGSNATGVLAYLNELRTREFTEQDLSKILKTQQLVEEIGAL